MLSSYIDGHERGISKRLAIKSAVSSAQEALDKLKMNCSGLTSTVRPSSAFVPHSYL